MVSGRIAQAANQLWANAVSTVTGPSHRLRLCILFFLAVPQIYLLPQGSRDVALTTILTLLITPVVLLRTGSKRFGRLFWLMVALLVVRIAALAWSPEPKAGSQWIVLLGQFMVTLMLIQDALRQGHDVLRLIERFYWPWVAVEALLVVLFRFLPGVENFFDELIGGVVTGQNAITTLVPKGPNNVIDPAKAGGFFLNANVAAMFLGVNAMAGLAISRLTRSRRVRWIAVAALVAVPFTGSKLATVLALVLPAAAVVLYRVKVAPPKLFRQPGRLTLVVLGVPSLIAAGAAVFGFLDALGEALLGRTTIWAYGLSAFLDHPLLGLGYGGWEAGFPRYAAEHGVDRDDFPPHNVLLAVWAKTGLAGLLLTAVFFVIISGIVIRALSWPYKLDVKVAAFSAMGLGWVLVQGLGENTDIFGEIHLVPIVALLIAYLGQHAGEGNRYRGRHARGWGSEASAISPFGDVHSQPGDGAAALPSPVHQPGSGQPAGGGLG